MSISIQNFAGTQFLTQQGTWTSDDSRAIRFDDPLKALVFICARQIEDAQIFLPEDGAARSSAAEL